MCWRVLENQLKVREKSVKSQGILLELTAGNPVNVLVRDKPFDYCRVEEF